MLCKISEFVFLNRSMPLGPLISSHHIPKTTMSKSIDVQLSQLKFPSTCCVVCMSPVATEYELQKTFSYGRRSYTVKVSVPMCSQHFESASFKGTAEKLVGTLGLIGGIGAGLLVTIILLISWQETSHDSLILKLFAGGVFGLGIFVMVWAVIALGLAPLFAEPTSKEARNAVRITHYWPKDQFVRLEFENEPLAEIVQRTT